MGSLVLFCIPLWMADSLNRRTKSMFDWNWIDALILGFTQLLHFIPGAGRQTGAFTGALFRNYNREAASKYVFFTLAPVLAYRLSQVYGTIQWGAPQPDPALELSWLSFGTGTGVALITSLVALGGLTKNIVKKGFRGYIFYRCSIALGAGLYLFFS